MSSPEFCVFCDIEYKEVIMHGSTRWLSLQKAVDRNLQLYKSLKSYFLSNRKLIYVEKTSKQYPQTNLTPASKTKFTFP